MTLRERLWREQQLWMDASLALVAAAAHAMRLVEGDARPAPAPHKSP
jgi:hypothetical protein